MAFIDAGGASRLGGMKNATNALPEGEMDALLLGRTRELVAATPTNRNYKGILIALIVICAVCGLILLAIHLLRPPDTGPRVKGRKIEIKDIICNQFVVQPFNGSWISETEIVFEDYLGGLSILNADTLTLKQLITNSTSRRLYSHKYAVSPDRKFILYIHDERAVWEHSFVAKYTIYDIRNEYPIPLTPFSEKNPQHSSSSGGQVELQYVEWSPNNGSSLVFVYQNNIYYKPDARADSPVQVTKDGRPGYYFNGIPDWLYEVEIFKANKAIWMQPKGEFLLYASFNDSSVGEVLYPWYGDSLPYSKLRSIRYPKAGTNNPEVTLWATRVGGQTVPKPTRIVPPVELDSRDHYITGIEWIDNDEVVVIWMNRHQNTAILSKCPSTTWICKEFYTAKYVNPSPVPGQTQMQAGWLDIPQLPIFSRNKSSCLLRIPWRDGKAGYFHHVVWFDVATRREVPITQGPFEVTKIVAWDQFDQYIYFIGVPQGKPSERHLYRAAEKSSNSTQIVAPVCLTCPPRPTPYHHHHSLNINLDEIDIKDILQLRPEAKQTRSTTTTTPKPAPDADMIDYTFPSSRSSFQLLANASEGGEAELFPDYTSICLYNSVTFNSKQRYFIRECLGPGVPTVTLHSAPSGQIIYILNNNSVLQQEAADLGLPLVKTFRVEVSSGYHAPVRLFLPPGIRDDEEFKFPLILHMGGSPGSQLVSDAWKLSWTSYLTSQKNFVVVEIDGRGSGFQGESIKHSVYGKLGPFQVTDQLEVVKYLRDNLTFVDGDNMAIWGWGYGGYLTLLTLAEDAENMFRSAVAVAPITKWEFYDSAYTERYMGMPNFTDNYGGYEQGDATRIVKKLATKKFLIVHGTADEKVHYQHTLYLTKALIKEGVSFTEQIYPDEGHDLLGVAEHFYATMEHFIDQNFDELDWKDWEKANYLGVKT